MASKTKKVKVSAVLMRAIGIAGVVMVILTTTTMNMHAATGNAAQFIKSSNTFIAATSSTELKTFSALTVEAWIRPSGTSGEWSLIMGKQYNPGDSNPWYSYRLCKSNFGSFPDTVNFNIAPDTTGGEAGVTSTTVVQNDTWTHVAGVYDGATMKIYINGNLENTVDQTGDLKESDFSMYIGKAPWTNYNNFNGQMDELRVWNVARTQAQIQYAMNRSLAGNETGLVAYWPFNDVAGSPTAADASQYDHVGTLYNGAAIVADSTAPICTEPPVNMVSWWKAENNGDDSVGTNHGTVQNGATYGVGQVGQAFSLDGVDDYVELPEGFADFTSGFTIGLWANPTASGNWARFLELGNGFQANNILFLRRQDTSQLAFQVYSGSTLTGTAYAENAITNDEWHYYAATMDATGQVQLYKDGLPLVMAASTVAVPENITRSNNSIGKSSWPVPPDANYAGKIDEVEIFNRALTAEEIATLYNSSLSLTGTCGIDSTPDAFSFTDQTNVGLSTVAASTPNITVTGITIATAISIASCTGTNCEYKINGGAWTADAGTVINGDTITVHQTSSAGYSTQTDLVLNIGGVTDTFSVTTIASPRTLTATKAGTGSGTVTGTGIDCGEDCSEVYDNNTTASLSATPATGSTFTGWSGDCSGSASPVDVVMSSDKTCTATFTLNQYSLTVTKEGTGSGTVGGAGTYPYQTPIQVTAAAATGSTFTGWSGDCSGTTSPYVIMVNNNKTCVATFTLNQYTVSASAGGNGSLDAGTTSPQTVNYNATTHFIFNAATGYHIASISGCGINYINTDTAVTNRDETTAPITGDCAVSATFAINSYTLTINKTGTGTVTSTPGGIDCGPDCTEEYNFGAGIILTAVPADGGIFTGWSSGGCTGTAPCTITINGEKEITATFKNSFPWPMFLPATTQKPQ